MKLAGEIENWQQKTMGNSIKTFEIVDRTGGPGLLKHEYLVRFINA